MLTPNSPLISGRVRGWLATTRSQSSQMVSTSLHAIGSQLAEVASCTAT